MPAQIIWFSESHRFIQGRPDARYGWMETETGPCIVKALDLEGSPTQSTLQAYETSVLAHLNRQAAPVPMLYSGDAPGGLITRFSGLSLRVLAGLPGAEHHFPFEERLSSWFHFLKQAECYVRLGALPVDIWEGNLLLPLTATTAGQVQPQTPVLVDHAHTVVTGFNLRRPVWIGSHMRRIPPELRACLKADQERLLNTYRKAGVDMTGDDPDLSPLQRDEAKRIWANYDAAQEIQLRLDRGELNVGAAIQYAVGAALQQTMTLASPTQANALKIVLNILLDEAPSKRYPTLADAAQALLSIVPTMPRTSAHFYPTIRPDQLKPNPIVIPVVSPPLSRSPVADTALPHDDGGAGTDFPVVMQSLFSWRLATLAMGLGTLLGMTLGA